MPSLSLRGVGVVLAVGALLSLSGCAVPKYRLQVVNAGDYPITSVKLVPFLADAKEQAEAFEEAVNLLPTDANNATISLASGETATVANIIPAGPYYVIVHFFVHGEYEVYQMEDIAELTEMEDGALVIMTVKRDRPDAKSEPKIEIKFTYTMD